MTHTAPVALRRHPGAFVAAAILLLTACTDSGNRRATGTPTPAPSATTPSVTGTAPSDPARAEDRVRTDWETFFAAATPLDAKVALVEDGGQYALMVQDFADDKQAGRLRAQVQDVAFTSAAEAEVTYTLSRQGSPVATNPGTAVLQDGTWKISLKTLCALTRLGADVPQAAGCR